MSDHFQRLNLNLLPILDALLESRSVTRAGERFGLSQPAASAALAKLRTAFDDPLLVPVGREMKLTPKAERMREPVRQLLALLETTFDADDLDPKDWSGEFILATADAVVALLLPDLIRSLEAASSKLTVRTTNITRSSASNLRNGDIDMIIAPPEIIDDTALVSRRLFSDRFVVVYSREHPPTDASLEAYMQRSHIASVIDSTQISSLPHSYFNQAVDSLRMTQRNLAVIPYYSLLPFLVSGTPWMTLAQERLARRFMEFLPIEYADPPTPLPPLDLHMFWSPKFNGDPRHNWMRNAIFEAGGQYR